MILMREGKYLWTTDRGTGYRRGGKKMDRPSKYTPSKSGLYRLLGKGLDILESSKGGGGEGR